VAKPIKERHTCAEGDLAGVRLVNADLRTRPERRDPGPGDARQRTVGRSELNGARLAGAQLSGAKFHDASPSETHLAGARLPGAHLFGVHL
jgi:uncharacterized protein YjbI with pentapeptide repeats